MTTATDAPISVDVVTLPRYLRWIREGLDQRIARRRLYRRTLTELMALSDRDCLDLGIDRFARREIAWQTARAS
jgi:uncharacterized protein YjiS (DUF1127 family)